jgi:hypothetical protein
MLGELQNEITKMMENVNNLPVSASTGFMGTSKKVSSINPPSREGIGLGYDKEKTLVNMMQ